MSTLRLRCYLCKSAILDRLVAVEGYTLYKCRKCDLVETAINNNLKLSSINEAIYSNEYLLNYETREAKFRQRFLSRLKDIEFFRTGGNLLDVGCSTGIFLRAVQENSKYKWKLFGIDVNTRSIKFARTKSKAYFSQTTLHRKRFKEKFFDCVTCFDVLEHDPDISGNLKEIYRILKPGGLLVIQSPNYKSLMAFLAGEYWDWWSVPDHVVHFTPQVLFKILADRNFIIKKEFTWEPASEFVENIRGSLKKRITTFMSINRIVSKLSTVPLHIIRFIIWLVEKQLNIGGLIVIYAIKN